MKPKKDIGTAIYPTSLHVEVEKGTKYYLAFCPEIPEANGQGRTAAAAVEDLASSVAFFFECEWKDSLGIAATATKSKRRKGHAA